MLKCSVKLMAISLMLNGLLLLNPLAQAANSPAKQPPDPVQQLKAQVVQVQRENQALKNQVNQLKNDVQTLKTKQTQFESRMQVLENYIRTRSRAPYIQ